jgi:hypothetical protein
MMRLPLPAKVARVVAMCAWMAASAQAQDRTVGAGFMVGDPTGVTGKFWLDDARALDFAAGWSLGENDAIHFSADHLWHRFDLLTPNQGSVALYAGIGARVALRDDEGKNQDHDDTFGLRVPLGIAYFTERMPLEIFAELAPVMELIPDTDLDVDLGIGLRYYFR